LGLATTINVHIAHEVAEQIDDGENAAHTLPNAPLYMSTCFNLDLPSKPSLQVSDEGGERPTLRWSRRALPIDSDASTPRGRDSLDANRRGAAHRSGK